MDKKIIGIKMRELRLKEKKSVEEVAISLGVTASAINNYELGLRIPRDEVKKSFANLFKVSIESIFFT